MTTEQLAAYVAGSDARAIPARVLENAKRLLLDGIGCLLAGTRGAPAAMAARMAAHLNGGVGGSTIMVDGTRASARDAAFVNGITLYSVGVNDIHKASGSHPGGCVIPALLAVAEWQRAPGDAMLAAMIAGYDVMGRLGRASMPAHRERGFHPTGTYGTFAATAAVGRLLALDPGTLASALGIAGSQAAGLVAFQTDGSLTMVFHAGRAAQNGVESCLLAREGYTGPHAVLEDPHGGFLPSTAAEYRPDALTHALGEFFEVEDTTFRPFYGCTYTVAASSATHEILQRHPRRTAEDVARIVVRCHPIVEDEVGDPDPRTLLAARLSMQFNLGLVLARGDVMVGDVGDDDLWDPRVRRLFPLVAFETDDSMPPWASAVSVHYADGTADSAQAYAPKGDPANPMTWDDTEGKFHRLVESAGGAQGLDRIVQAVRALETIDGRTLAGLIDASARSMGAAGQKRRGVA
jgi:2-methylcitrate dehydratase PrpD